MADVQEWIHKLEQGTGTRYLKHLALFLTLLTLTASYNWRAYRNMATEEAMDSAQLARNLAEGKGYTTLFIRPLSIYLLQKASAKPAAALTPGTAQLDGLHPDLANPPAYPLVLAGLMKILPFHFEISMGKSFWNENQKFWWYQPDFFISLFNQALFFLCILLVFFLARRLFDATVAWLSATVFLLTETFWRFSASGLSTMLLLLIFLGLVWCLALLEQGAREGTRSERALVTLAALAGALVGVGALTRYSFGWLMIPVFVFLLSFFGQRRVVLCLAATGAFLVFMAPWVVRNYQVSGTSFGTAGYAAVEATSAFPGNRLERALNPDFRQVGFYDFWYKFLSNTRQIIQSDIPKIGGSWVTAFFLVGLLVGFLSPTISRLRYFLMFSLAVLVVVQALGRTHLSDDSPEINSENLLVLLAPLVFMYAVSMFLLLLGRINFPVPQARYLVIGLFLAVAGMPLIFALLPPRAHPMAYPPYFPPVIQNSARWMKESELMMSDIPWAVAWYGKRQCIWVTLNAQEEFFAINDYQKPIKALYLTPKSLDARFLTDWMRADEHSWGRFIMECLSPRHEVPPSFPLRKAPLGFLPEQMFLTDSERWVATPRQGSVPHIQQ
ncbi:MAG: glycosyltransferase family 39 protein [Verrucomicrobia bacterium]|nr:glycosyltransferase family 39 protein [Verrucomicrobiota bacterium]